jgi:hypothetical protein
MAKEKQASDKRKPISAQKLNDLRDALIDLVPPKKKAEFDKLLTKFGKEAAFVLQDAVAYTEGKA